LLAQGDSHLLEVHAVIGMDQHISHPCHLPPGNLRIFLAAAVAQPFGGFSNDLKIAYNRVLKNFARQERFAIGDGKSLNSPDRGQDVE